MTFVKNDVVDLLNQMVLPPNESLPDGASEEMIIDFESRNKICVPPVFRSLLLFCNGPCVGPGGFAGISITRESQDIDHLFDLYPSWLAKGWIPIAGDGCGNYYLVATNGEFGVGEPVFFVDVIDDEEIPSFIVSSNPWSFLKFIFKKELGQSKWPFDRIEFEKNDPEVFLFRAIAFPWDA